MENEKNLRLRLHKEFEPEIERVTSRRLGPSSIKTREVLGNLEGRGDGFPNTSRVLVEDGHSLIINFSTGSGSGNPSLWTGKD